MDSFHIITSILWIWVPQTGQAYSNTGRMYVRYAVFVWFTEKPKRLIEIKERSAQLPFWTSPWTWALNEQSALKLTPRIVADDTSRNQGAGQTRSRFSGLNLTILVLLLHWSANYLYCILLWILLKRWRDISELGHSFAGCIWIGHHVVHNITNYRKEK